VQSRNHENERSTVVAVTEKRIKSAKVCRESISSDNKDDDTAVTTQAHFTEVTDILDEAMCFS